MGKNGIMNVGEVIMWGNKFSKANYELVISRIGKKEYNKEITNLILTKIDMESTFCHHLLPEAMEYLVTLFGHVIGSDDMFTNLDTLKRYYREGEMYNEEYLCYLGELGVSNEHESFFCDYAKEKAINSSVSADYVERCVQVYRKYSRTNMLNIIKLEDRINKLKEEFEKRSREEEDKEISKEKKVRGISKILDYFKRV